MLCEFYLSISSQREGNVVGLVWDSTPELEAGSAPRGSLLREKGVHPIGPEDLPQGWPSVSPGCSNKLPQTAGHKKNTVYHLMAREATIQNRSLCPVRRLQGRSNPFLAFLAASLAYIPGQTLHYPSLSIYHQFLTL